MKDSLKQNWERYSRLNALASPTLEILKQLFPSYEVRTEPWPTVDNFTDLPPYKAFSRINIASNVSRFRTSPEPPKDQVTQDAILKRMHDIFEARQKQRQQTQPAPASPSTGSTGSPQAANIRQPKKATDEDFSY